MAIYSLSVSIISGNKGQSVVAHVAYQSGERIYDEMDGKTKNYSRKERVVLTGIAVPEHAPGWALNREKLWNEVEKKEGIHGQYARNWMIALPNELNVNQQEKLVRVFTQDTFAKRGMVADWAIHKAEPGNSKNDHVHITTTLRPFKEDGSWDQKSRSIMIHDENNKPICMGRDKNGRKYYKQRKCFLTDWNKKETLLAIRKDWAIICNRFLADAGINARIDERSYKERGIDKLPQVHLGYAATAMERRGEKTRLGDINRAIVSRNAEHIKNRKEI